MLRREIRSRNLLEERAFARRLLSAPRLKPNTKRGVTLEVKQIDVSWSHYFPSQFQGAIRLDLRRSWRVFA